MSVRVTVVGDALLDIDLEGRIQRLCPDAPAPVLDDPVERPRPGGAALAAALLRNDGVDVTLVTAVGNDAAGDRLRDLVEGLGIELVDLGLDGPTPEKMRVRARGHSVVRIDRGGAVSTCGDLSARAKEAMDDADALLVSDYGRGISARSDVRASLGSLAHERPIIWDPHPRGAHPVRGIRLATPNRSEASLFARTPIPLAPAVTSTGTGVPVEPSAGRSLDVDGDDLPRTASCARRLVTMWGIEGVCVTLGSRGALYQANAGSPVFVPALAFEAHDACGAGDRFAGSASAALAMGADPVEAIGLAVAAASAFVGNGGAAGWTLPTVPTAPAPSTVHARDVIARVRSTGGTVVAAGGCFDLLHAGHVRVLEDARSLGDCLIVCVNSDRSIARLKGPGRPVVEECDRVAVLRALSCVDAVVIFDEETPTRVLRELKPDVFAKGGDYFGRTLPEAQLLDQWGGACVILPYLEGRSTTRLITRIGNDSDEQVDVS